MKVLLIIIIALLITIVSLMVWKNNNTININKLEVSHPQSLVQGSVVVVGTARNIENYVLLSVQKMIDIGSLFEKYHIIISESNSSDNTKLLLKKMSLKFPEIITTYCLNDNSESRTVRISNARNVILDSIKDLDYIPDYYISMDMDDRSIIDYKSILTCFDENSPRDWIMFGGNNNGDYYDLWALRTMDDWQREDCWRAYNYDNTYELKYRSVKDFVKVNSCFNGIAIYKYKYISDCRYDGEYDPDITIRDICEHVPFNMCVKSNANHLNMYINPYMLVG